MYVPGDCRSCMSMFMCMPDSCRSCMYVCVYSWMYSGMPGDCRSLTLVYVYVPGDSRSLTFVYMFVYSGGLPVMCEKESLLCCDMRIDC
jgi:hypothetical protein